MARFQKSALNRRNFIQSTTVGAAALAAGGSSAKAQQAQPVSPGVTPPNAAAREAETGTPASVEVLTNERPGSDFMVDVIKSLGIEYICSNPGSSFRSLHESVINYGGNRNPEFLTCCHEESAVGMAHGYSKIEGKPLVVFAHGTVGLQHAAMAIYNAYCDRVPVYVIFGNIANATNRRPGVEWAHSVQDGASLVRDFTKWDDAPTSLTHFAESAVRAYKIAMTPPMSPIVLVADGDLQEDPIAADARLSIPKLTLAAPPQGESGAVAEAASDVGHRGQPGDHRRSRRAHARRDDAADGAGRSAASPGDRSGRAHEFPHAPPAESYRAQPRAGRRRRRDPGSRAHRLLGDRAFLPRSAQTNLAVHHQAGRQADQHHRGRSVPAQQLSGLRALSRSRPGHRRRRRGDAAVFDRGREASDHARPEDALSKHRGAKLAAAARDALERTRTDATYAWDASPISTARLSAELWAQIKNDDWSLVSDVPFVSRWPLRLWNFDKHYQYIGGSGGAGVGYGAPAAVGAALANRKRGRLSVSIQNDGDLMYAPAVLWTAAHHKIPLLSVMHNNRAYHQELMHVQRMADRHNRGIDRAVIGTTLEDPNIDYSKIAQGLGVHAEGPITDPKDLGPALKRAVEIVRRGEPALVDVVTQPR